MTLAAKHQQTSTVHVVRGLANYVDYIMLQENRRVKHYTQ